MKTFEERYTAWIDGELAGPAQVGFEQELARRSAEGEARADKADAACLHRLLTTHLQAPALTNPDFFNHQLRERIEADRVAARRRAERAVRAPWFGWSLARVAGVGAAFAFVSTALYYGLAPEGRPPSPSVAYHEPVPSATDLVKPPANQVPPAPAPGPGKSLNDHQYASLNTAPSVLTPNTDIQDVKVAEPSAQTTTATPLHYQAPDVNVLWLDGLEYLPNVPGDNTPTPAPAAGATP